MEDRFVAEHSDELTKLNATGRSGDDCFRIETKGKIEIKSELYKLAKTFKGHPHKHTPNAAIERWSVVEHNLPGGPWKAVQDNAEAYIQYFPRNDGLCFVFEPKELIAELELYIKEKNPKEFKTCSYNKNNTVWHTTGYAIPVKDLMTFSSLKSISYKNERLFK